VKVRTSGLRRKALRAMLFCWFLTTETLVFCVSQSDNGSTDPTRNFEKWKKQDTK
jgi:hypothetical protein